MPSNVYRICERSEVIAEVVIYYQRSNQAFQLADVADIPDLLFPTLSWTDLESGKHCRFHVEWVQKPRLRGRCLAFEIIALQRDPMVLDNLSGCASRRRKDEA